MDERLSWPGWLTYSGRFAHISGHPSATGRAQDRESSPAIDRRSTTVPRNQLEFECFVDCQCPKRLFVFGTGGKRRARMSGDRGCPVNLGARGKRP